MFGRAAVSDARGRGGGGVWVSLVARKVSPSQTPAVWSLALTLAAALRSSSASARRNGRKPGRAVPDGPELALAKRWRAQPDCPGWGRRFSAETWPRSLSAYAAHGWTERDLNQALRDVAAMGIRIYGDPRRPIPYLLMLLRRSNIEERPTIRFDAQAAEELAVARDRAARVPQRHVQHHQDRQAAIAALSGPARAQVLAIAAGAAQRAHRNREREVARRQQWREQP